MNGLRLVFVTRRFWPLVGGAEMVMANLASELRDSGATVTIVTAQWHADWPKEVVHREIPVVRLPNPAQRGWGTLRYMLALSSWLRKHRDEMDLVYVSMLKHDAHAAVGALAGARIPVVLRAEGGGEAGDCNWQNTARFGPRIKRRCQTADAFVAPSEPIEQELLAAGYASPRVHRIANGVAIPPPHELAARMSARAALADVNSDLRTEATDPVVVYTGRLHEAKGLDDLLRAWPGVVEHFPAARLWLVGDGPYRDKLFETLLDLEIRVSVVMPGSFDDVHDVLLAADLFVLPSHAEGMSVALLEAMAASVPVVATDIPGNRALVTHREHGLLVPPHDPAALRDAIVLALSHPRRVVDFAAAAREKVIQQFSLARMAAEHLRLFEQIVAEKRK